MKEKVESILKFFYAHRAKFAVGLTATAFLLLMRRNAREIESFMKDHDLLTEYRQWLIEE